LGDTRQPSPQFQLSIVLTLPLQVNDVLPIVQYAVNEECVSYTECSSFAPFIKAGKPVFHIEYPTISGNKASASETKKICSTDGDAEGSDGFSTVIKKMGLDGWIEFCDGKTAVTTVNLE
jgi:hypothetical protein